MAGADTRRQTRDLTSRARHDSRQRTHGIRVLCADRREERFAAMVGARRRLGMVLRPRFVHTSTVRRAILTGSFPPVKG